MQTPTGTLDKEIEAVMKPASNNTKQHSHTKSSGAAQQMFRPSKTSKNSTVSNASNRISAQAINKVKVEENKNEEQEVFVEAVADSMASESAI